MRKIFRLAFLAGVLVLTASTLNVKPAYAFGSCENIDGGACSPEGRTLRCLWAEPGGQGECLCTNGLWSCY